MNRCFCSLCAKFVLSGRAFEVPGVSCSIRQQRKQQSLWYRIPMAIFVRRSTSVLVLADRRCRLPATDKASTWDHVWTWTRSSPTWSHIRPAWCDRTSWFLSRYTPQHSGLAAAVVTGRRRRCHTANCCSSQDDYWQTRVWASWLLLCSAMIGLASADKAGRNMTGTERRRGRPCSTDRPGPVRLLKTGLWRTTAAVQYFSSCQSVQLLSCTEPQQLRLVGVHLEPVAAQPSVQTFSKCDKLLNCCWRWCRERDDVQVPNKSGSCDDGVNFIGTQQEQWPENWALGTPKISWKTADSWPA